MDGVTSMRGVMSIGGVISMGGVTPDHGWCHLSLVSHHA